MQLGRSTNGVAVSTIEDLRDEIVREERVTNLRADGTVTEAEIHRRRLQIFLLALVVLVGLLFTTVANDVWTQFRDGSWIDPEVARIALIGFGICCVLYVYDKEQHLKRLSRLGRDVQDLDAQLAAGMLRSALVAEASEIVHETLELDDVAQRVVDQASRLVGATSASLRLTDEEGGLHPVAAQVDVTVRDLPEPAEPNADMLDLVGNTHEPALLNSGTVSVLCVPIVRQDRLLGLIALSAAADNRFDDGDAALLGRFAIAVASAIANAQRYEAAVFLLDRGTEDLPAA
jgi:uncharacterized protein YigA (DUF484 family)